MVASDRTVVHIPLRYLALLLVAALGIVALVAIFSSKETPVDVPTPPPPVPEAKPVTRLKLEVTGCSRSFGYTQISGYVKNTGEVAVRFVSITTVWRDADNRRVDYGTIFVVGAEDLHPGERAPFKDSSHNSKSQKCSATLEDWWSHNREGSE
jgi:hypothetical protein|tara:strand:+ start:13550 stop:14008 length:459 start_codon:yes stop_codon:yes gene_type:complete